MNIKTILDLLKETFAEWNKDKASRLAAALAYYTVFSGAVADYYCNCDRGRYLGRSSKGRDCWANSRVSKDGAVIQTAIENANKPTTGTIASVISVVVLSLEHLGICRASRCSQHRLGGEAGTRSDQRDSKPSFNGAGRWLFTDRVTV